MGSKQIKRHPNELELPSVHDEPEAEEVLRLWTTEEDVLYRYKTHALPVFVWAEALGMVAKSLAGSFATATGGKPEDILKFLRHEFNEYLDGVVSHDIDEDLEESTAAAVN